MVIQGIAMYNIFPLVFLFFFYEYEFGEGWVVGTKRRGAILSGFFFPIALFARKQFVSELSGRTIAFAVRDRSFTKMDWVSSLALGRPHSYKEE